MTNFTLPPLPLSLARLEAYRVRSRQQSRPSLVGGHLMRRKGQSLEFRELGTYILGDDVRHIDWQASARYGTVGDLLVRHFAAEEQLTLVLSIDTRDTMRLPKAMSKLQIALWLAEAIATVGLRSDDRVVLHRLFGRASGSLVALRGGRSLTRIRPTLRRFAESDAVETSLNAKLLEPYVPPTAVWVILTDFYFELDEQTNRLGRQIAAAQDGLRWVILVDLDSWPHEKALLGLGGRQIEGPGAAPPNEMQFEIADAGLTQVATNIAAHKQQFQRHIHRSGFDSIVWPWPAIPNPNPDQFFRERFITDQTLRRLFMREVTL